MRLHTTMGLLAATMICDMAIAQESPIVGSALRVPALRAARMPAALAPAMRDMRVKALQPSSAPSPQPAVSLTYRTPSSADQKLWLTCDCNYDASGFAGGFTVIRDTDHAGLAGSVQPGKAYVVDLSVYPTEGTLHVTGGRYGPNVPSAKFDSAVPIVGGHALVILPATAAAQISVVTSRKDGDAYVLYGAELTPLN